MESDIIGKMLILSAGRLSERGLQYEVVYKQEDAQKRLSQIKKHSPLPPMDVGENDFMRTKIIWVFFSDQDGVDVGVGAARLEELGDEDVMAFWARYAERRFPGKGYRVPPIGISGNLVHVGDVFFKPEWREPHGHIRAAMFCIYVNALIQWRHVTTIYAFVSQDYMMSGSAVEYSATGQIPVPNVWPGDDLNPLYFVWMPVEKLNRQARAYLSTPELFDSYKHSIRSHLRNSVQQEHQKTSQA